MKGDTAPGRGRRTVALLVGAAGSGAAFLGIVGLVMAGKTRAFDERTLLALRNRLDPADPLGPPWFEETARDITALGSNGVLALLVLPAVGFLVAARRRTEAALLAAVFCGALLLESTTKHWISHPRPDLVPHAARVFTTSLPSGHATMSAAVYLTAGALLARAVPDTPRLRAWPVAVGGCLLLLIGLSRVYLGLHWATDVAAGWALGISWAALCWTTAGMLGVRAVENPLVVGDMGEPDASSGASRSGYDALDGIEIWDGCPPDEASDPLTNAATCGEGGRPTNAGFPP